MQRIHSRTIHRRVAASWMATAAVLQMSTLPVFPSEARIKLWCVAEVRSSVMRCAGPVFVSTLPDAFVDKDLFAAGGRVHPHPQKGISASTAGEIEGRKSNAVPARAYML